jgi:hypothetical protein
MMQTMIRSIIPIGGFRVLQLGLDGMSLGMMQRTQREMRFQIIAEDTYLV